jgi:hypothetical protein
VTMWEFLKTNCLEFPDVKDVPSLTDEEIQAFSSGSWRGTRGEFKGEYLPSWVLDKRDERWTGPNDEPMRRVIKRFSDSLDALAARVKKIKEQKEQALPKQPDVPTPKEEQPKDSGFRIWIGDYVPGGKVFYPPNGTPGPATGHRPFWLDVTPLIRRYSTCHLTIECFVGDARQRVDDLIKQGKIPTNVPGYTGEYSKRYDLEKDNYDFRDDKSVWLPKSLVKQGHNLFIGSYGFAENYHGLQAVCFRVGITAVSSKDSKVFTPVEKSFTFVPE